MCPTLCNLVKLIPKKRRDRAIDPDCGLSLGYGEYINKYGVVNKKVFHKSEEKMPKKMKMTLQRAKNLVLIKQHYGVSFCIKIFFFF